MIQRQTNLGKVLEGRFINKVLTEESQDINDEISTRMSGFSTSTSRGRNFVVRDHELTYSHPMRNRFIDMKTRQTEKGKIKKKNYKVHNNVLFGYANNIVRRLSYGFTEDVKKEMMKLDGIRI